MEPTCEYCSRFKVCEYPSTTSTCRIFKPSLEFRVKKLEAEVSRLRAEITNSKDKPPA